jgi:hypothetical protein
MNEEVDQNNELPAADNLFEILKKSLLGTIAVMWTVGGIVTILNLFNLHWFLGWVSAFVWLWGCWAAVLYFDLKRYVHF